MITINVRGSTKRIEGFLRRNQKIKISNLDTYGVMGVNALAAATPVDTGITASSWDYTIVEEDGKTSIIWTNSNVVKGQNIAVILNYGHGTRNGGYVVGRNYIEPALAPVFDEIAAKAWQEVTET
jgi:hypothetical protein